MRLHLIRHPRPLVQPGTCYGSTDVPVDAQHVEQVLEALLPALPAHAPLYCSPLQRCAALAARLAQALHASAPVHDARLVELHFGAWEMRDWNAIPREEIDAWVADLAGYRPGDGESVMQAVLRLQDFLDHAKALGADDIIVVAHAGVIRILLEIGNGTDARSVALAAANARRNIAYGELIVLDC